MVGGEMVMGGEMTCIRIKKFEGKTIAPPPMYQMVCPLQHFRSDMYKNPYKVYTGIFVVLDYRNQLPENLLHICTDVYK